MAMRKSFAVVLISLKDLMIQKQNLVNQNNYFSVKGWAGVLAFCDPNPSEESYHYIAYTY